MQHFRDFDDYNANTGATTVYIAVGASDSPRVTSVKMKWDAVLTATITLEETNFPDVALTSTTAGDWDAVTGFTASPAAAAGGATFNILDRGARRFRLKVVASAGGVLRVRTHGKE